MSRIAKKPLVIPDKVQVTKHPDYLEVKGPRGTLQTPIPEGIDLIIEQGKVTVNRDNDWPSRKANQGMAFRLLDNAMIGVTTGFKKELDIIGIGYKAALQGENLVLTLGYSNDIIYPVPKGIKIELPQPTRIIITGNDKQQVGQIAAEIRELRKPDVYKGKGVRYVDEIVRKKVGKAGV